MRTRQVQGGTYCVHSPGDVPYIMGTLTPHPESDAVWDDHDLGCGYPQ